VISPSDSNVQVRNTGKQHGVNHRTDVPPAEPAERDYAHLHPAQPQDAKRQASAALGLDAEHLLEEMQPQGRMHGMLPAGRVSALPGVRFEGGNCEQKMSRILRERYGAAALDFGRSDEHACRCQAVVGTGMLVGRGGRCVESGVQARPFRVAARLVMNHGTRSGTRMRMVHTTAQHRMQGQQTHRNSRNPLAH
jgi:hypothetical protein